MLYLSHCHGSIVSPLDRPQRSRAYKVGAVAFERELKWWILHRIKAHAFCKTGFSSRTCCHSCTGTLWWLCHLRVGWWPMAWRGLKPWVSKPNPWLSFSHEILSWDSARLVSGNMRLGTPGQISIGDLQWKSKGKKEEWIMNRVTHPQEDIMSSKLLRVVSRRGLQPITPDRRWVTKHEPPKWISEHSNLWIPKRGWHTGFSHPCGYAPKP